MRIGQKLKCVNSRGMSHWITEGGVYTFSGLSTISGLYCLSETGSVGYFAWRFVPADDRQDYERFMGRVLKPVDLGKPVTA